MRTLAALVLAGGLAAVVRPAFAGDEDGPCEPACGAGETCFKGTCMVPAPAPVRQPQPAPAYPPQAYPYPPQAHPYPPQPYAYPPPAPYGYPPSGYYPPPPPAARRGFLALPYVGINSFSGEGTTGLDPGLRLGAILGGRVSDIFSANGELTIDIMNPDVPEGTSVSEAMVHMTFSPLFHARTTNAEIVLGPKLGLWALSGHASTYGASVDFEQQGWTIGGNAGVFFPVGGGTTSLGMLLSYANLQLTRSCATTGVYGQQCSEADGSADVFGLTFAALF